MSVPYPDLAVCSSCLGGGPVQLAADGSSWECFRCREDAKDAHPLSAAFVTVRLTQPRPRRRGDVLTWPTSSGVMLQVRPLNRDDERGAPVVTVEITGGAALALIADLLAAARSL